MNFFYRYFLAKLLILGYYVVRIIIIVGVEIMKRITVETSQKKYDILVGENIIFQLKLYTDKYDKVLILSNDKVASLYFEEIKEVFSEENFYYFTILDGEKEKNINSVLKIYDFMVENEFSRKSLIISLGGGVICDIGGYVAGTYMRGIDFIQVPTSLLAQVDASIGGKTAIDHLNGKNLIGVFKQPDLVLIDIKFLRTLPEIEFKSGMVEIIKHGIIKNSASPDYLFFIEKYHEEIKKLSSEHLLKLIMKSCIIKKNFVEADEFENGIRAFLNLGHTYGHAIEKIYNYENITHGEAVAKGIIFELYLSNKLKNMSFRFIERIMNIFEKYGIDYTPICFDEDILISTMKKDKKNSYDKINFIILDNNHNLMIESIEKEEIVFFNKEFKNRRVRGIIDIGTNTCRLFLAEIDDKKNGEIEVKRELLKKVEIVKLGENVDKNRVLSGEAIVRTIKCLEEYKNICDKYGAFEVIAFATSATRDAKNRDEFLENVRKLKIDIRCISGDEEAEFNFRGNSLAFSEKMLILDIGGGSTEFSFGKENLVFSKSIDIGAVRITERFFKEQNYSEKNLSFAINFIKESIKDVVKSLKDKEFMLIGVAGTVTTQVTVLEKIEEFNSNLVHKYRLKLSDLEKNLSLFLNSKRENIIGLESKRADVIIAGTLILITIMKELKRDEIVVSVSDNLNGAMINNFSF